MTCNVGGKDKTARLILGAVLVGFAFLGSPGSAVQIVLLVIAAMAFVTAFVGFCPLNRMLGIDTCKSD